MIFYSLLKDGLRLYGVFLRNSLLPALIKRLHETTIIYDLRLSHGSPRFHGMMQLKVELCRELGAKSAVFGVPKWQRRLRNNFLGGACYIVQKLRKSANVGRWAVHCPLE